MYLIKKVHPKYAKELLSVNRKTNDPIEKWAKDLNKHVTKDISGANKHLNR